MGSILLFAVTERGPLPLVVPESARDFVDLYAGLTLGVYTALRTFEHEKFLGLEEHIARTQLSMDLLGWKYTLDERRLRLALHQVVSSFPAQNARVRFDVLAEPAIKLGTKSRELIALKTFSPVPAQYYDEGVGVDFALSLHRDLVRAKKAEFAQQRGHILSGQNQDQYEHLILDDAGHILEGATSNFWAVRDGEVWTAGEGVLEGVTRKIILSLLPQSNIPIRLEAVHREDLAKVDEAAISGSSRAIMPVIRIRDQIIGDGRPGPIFRRILHRYRDYVAGAIRTAV